MNSQTLFFQSFGLEKVCVICGNPIGKLDRTKPSQYCNDHCRNYAKYKQALEKEILLIKPVSRSISIIRGDMFRLANLLSNGTKSLKDEI